MNKVFDLKDCIRMSFHDFLIESYNLNLEKNNNGLSFEDFPIDVFEELRKTEDCIITGNKVKHIPSGKKEYVKYKIQLKEVKSTSEILSYGEIWKVYDNCCIIATDSWRPVNVTHSNYMVAFFSDDFVNDTGESKLFKVFGYVINSAETKPIKVEENTVINVECDSVINSDSCCIQTSGNKVNLTIKGHGETLTLNAHSIQPCIGTKTSEGLSYGRWSIGYGYLSELTIDNVNVICNSDVPNFAIGTYGDNNIPIIDLINGGTIDCPEVKGKRIMVKSGAEGIYGSTKNYDPAVYEIENEKQSATDKLINIAKF